MNRLYPPFCLCPPSLLCDGGHTFLIRNQQSAGSNRCMQSKTPALPYLTKPGVARVYYLQGMLFRQSDLIQSGFLVTDRSRPNRAVSALLYRKETSQAGSSLFILHGEDSVKVNDIFLRLFGGFYRDGMQHRTGTAVLRQLLDGDGRRYLDPVAVMQLIAVGIAA